MGTRELNYFEEKKILGNVNYSNNNVNNPINLFNGNLMKSISNITNSFNNIPMVVVGQGENYSIAYSTDKGLSWTGIEGTNSIFEISYDIAYNGSRWIAVGIGNYSIAYSDDGINWSGIQDSTNNIFEYGYSVTWDGMKWISVGSINPNEKIIFYSLDGINWTYTNTIPFDLAGYGVASNGTEIVIVGETISGDNTIAYSNDNGNIWTYGINQFSRDMFSAYGIGITWNGNRWIACGSDAYGNNIKYSNDGKEWIDSSNPLDLSIYAAWNGNRWIVGGIDESGYNIKYSDDNGESWINSFNSPFLDQCNKIKWNGVRWIAVGGGNPGNTIAYSENNGLNWIPVNNSSNIFYYAFSVA
jgi:hypothetical protein